MHNISEMPFVGRLGTVFINGKVKNHIHELGTGLKSLTGVHNFEIAPQTLAEVYVLLTHIFTQK